MIIINENKWLITYLLSDRSPKMLTKLAASSDVCWDFDKLIKTKGHAVV